MNTALVVGASGIVGRGIISRLADAGWDVIGLCRRPMPDSGRTRYVAADLLDEGLARELGVHLGAVTHVFYTAYLQDPDLRRESELNLRMLRNVVDVVRSASPSLAHIQVMQGSKWYGSHLGPYRTPAREDQPRHPAAMFYHAQQDWLVAQQRGEPWTWSALRPHGVWGTAERGQLNMRNAIAVYATVLRQLGLPLYYPGLPGAYDAIYQCTDVAQLADAMQWAATAEAARNEDFNITNGDCFRWRHGWPVVARWFGMEVGDVQPFDVAEFMADKSELWADICATHDLVPHRLSDIASFGAATAFLFRAEWDQLSSLAKIRQAGFTGSVDSFEMIPRQLSDMAKERIIPDFGGWAA